ncbi:hypothetical protein B0O99DRAFT_733537 [Bisporella sp. PMI_857]|nr:hypothetical protein B0O99DRAFT_733537 [Bisporella sp. PMI_857]
MSARPVASRYQKSTENPVQQTRQNALESSPFGRLPNGVLLHIAEFLSTASKLALRRCCRHFSSVIRVQHLDSSEARKPPWEVLELEYPDHLECYYCQDLHPMDKIHKYAYSEARSSLSLGRCGKINHRARTAKFIHPNFSFTVFRMLMKQYRQGKNCDKLLELLAYRSGAVREGAQVKQVIATPKIVNGKLFMRLQTTYVIPPKEPSQMYLLSRNLLKCPHTDRWSRDNVIVTGRLFQKFAALEAISGGRQEHIMSCQCRICPTEFHLSLKRFEGEGVVLFITKWQDLGTGLSPLESDLPPVIGPRRIIRIGKMLDYESPRVRFEELAPGVDLEAISALKYEERRDLFGMSNSRLTQFKRTNDSICWQFRCFQRYPHYNAPEDHD